MLTPGSSFVIADMVLRAADAHSHRHSTLRPLSELLDLLGTTGFSVTEVTNLDEHLNRSLQRLSADLEHHRSRLTADHGQHAVRALDRVLTKTLPDVGTVFGYTVIVAHPVQTP